MIDDRQLDTYDIAQICLNRYVVNNAIHRDPEDNHVRCPDCGEPAIILAPSATKKFPVGTHCQDASHSPQGLMQASSDLKSPFRTAIWRSCYQHSETGNAAEEPRQRQKLIRVGYRHP